MDIDLDTLNVCVNKAANEIVQTIAEDKYVRIKIFIETDEWEFSFDFVKHKEIS